MTGGLVGLGVVVAQDVEDPVDDEQGQLVLQRPVVLLLLRAVLGGVAGGDGRADHRRRPAAAAARGVGAGPGVDRPGGARVGEPAGLDEVVLEREGEDVGGAGRCP